MTATVHISEQLPRERLLELLDYCPRTGAFTWKYRPDRDARWNERFAGKPAGGVYANGYRYICIDFVTYKATRLAWVIMTGYEPPLCVDHINGITTDDRWENLRGATKSQNGANRPKQKNNTSGFKGVSWHSRAKCWVAKIKCRGTHYHLGCFGTAEEASSAYRSASLKLFGEFSQESRATFNKRGAAPFSSEGRR
ncbi:HNH endonuclease [Brucella intermedia]|uniref:HNH endonuclease n=1 Tax=Brucella intermedia TaxID=94625 RepID=UPI00224B8831|nr:HNH endonuclease [Brucella intermedia]